MRVLRSGLGNLVDATHRVVVALQGPATVKPSGLVDGHAGGAFLRELVALVLGAHVFFAEVAGLVIEEPAVVL